ncbi:MAG: hypothetical protein ABI597_00835 [Gammaproteobacteria bacterium]
MTNSEFIYWLTGYLKLTDDSYLDEKQITIIKNHANLVQTVEVDLSESIRHFIADLEAELSQLAKIPIESVRKRAIFCN